VRDKIKAVLEELFDKGYMARDKGELGSYKPEVNKATLALDALYKAKYLGMLKGMKKGRKICFGEDCTSDKVKGFNSAIQEMREKMEG
jgi:enolase